MAYVSHVAGPSRVFDHLYDPTFVTSDKKDIWKANNASLLQSAPVYILSNYKCMFSNMPKQPPFTYWKPQNPLPHFPYQKDGNHIKRNNLQEKPENTISGRGLCNFFHYGGNQLIPINFKLNISIEKNEDTAPRAESQTVGCQTMYRESSAQTHPFLPEAVLAPGQIETPEILRISNLISGARRPGEFEANVIERARKRRLWEKQLPPLYSLKDWKKRSVVLEAFEWEEWVAREEEIENCHRMRYDLVCRLLQKRDHIFRNTSSAKIENTTKRIQSYREKQIRALKTKHARALRKLEMRRNKIFRKYTHVDILTEHSDMASDLYGPQMRFGVHPKRSHFVACKTNFEARLENLEKNISKPLRTEQHLVKLKKLIKPKEKTKEIVRGFCKDKNLKELYDSLKMLRKNLPSSERISTCLMKIVVLHEQNAVTPIGVDEDSEAENEFQACIYLQKIIKGRAVQNILCAGKDKCRGLIEEIQSTHQLSAVSAMYPGMFNEINKKRLMVLAQRKRLQQILESNAEVNELLQEAEAPTVGFLLDFLENELKQLQQERRQHALAMLAECQRKKREAEEARQKLVEQKHNQQFEEIQRHMTKASKDMVTLYLEDILVEEIDKISDIEARNYVQEIARRIDNEANKNLLQGHETPISDEDDENVVTNLVNNFLFPEVQKVLARRRMQTTRQRHLLEAHKFLYGDIMNMFKDKKNQSDPKQAINMILDNLVKKVVPSENALSELGSKEYVATHEALRAIKQIMDIMIPKKISKSTDQNVSQITKLVLETIHPDTMNERRIQYPQTSRSAMLDEIMSELNSELWEHAIEEADENLSEIECKTDPSNQSFINSRNSSQASSNHDSPKISNDITKFPRIFVTDDQIEQKSTATDKDLEYLKHTVLVREQPSDTENDINNENDDDIKNSDSDSTLV